MKTKFGYMALGAVLGIGGMLIGMSLSSVTAQNDRFGEITCTGLKVVNPDGTEAVELDSHFIKGYGYGGSVTVRGNGRKSPISGGTSSASMGVSSDGTYAIFWNSEGIPGVLMGSGHKGGYVRLDRKGFKGEDGSVSININENGGQVSVTGSNGKSGTILRVHDNQGGDVSVYDKNGAASAGMSAEITGGMVSVYDSDSKAGAALGVDSRRAGLMIFDKYGNPVVTLPQ